MPDPRPASPDQPARCPPTLIPLRVSTLELFFDLVFAFTLTQRLGGYRGEPQPGDAPVIQVHAAVSSACTQRRVTGSIANTSSRVVSGSRYSPGRIARSRP